MKLPITDEFLWDLYNMMNITGDIFSAITKPPTMANFLPGPKNPIFKKYKNQKNKATFSKLIYYLKKNNYIQVKNLQNRQAIIITKKGFSKVLKASFKMEKKQRRRDGKWVMVIFDIPQKYKKSRNLLTSILHNSGYKIFQQSAWVTPYDVSGKTEKLLQLHSLDKYVKLFLIEGI